MSNKHYVKRMKRIARGKLGYKGASVRDLYKVVEAGEHADKEARRVAAKKAYAARDQQQKDEAYDAAVQSKNQLNKMALADAVRATKSKKGA